mmetsp:Transcript_29844/g.41266  ORF Transcript_29844/g.41266 Transcript_29844/m.41266 type:complete len:89 (-) Transcript_29844:1612-1878(-)
MHFINVAKICSDQMSRTHGRIIISRIRTQSLKILQNIGTITFAYFYTDLQTNQTNIFFDIDETSSKGFCSSRSFQFRHLTSEPTNSLI